MVCLNFTLSAQVFIFFCHFAVNRAHFPDQLAVARWLRLNVTFMYSKKLCAKLNLTHRVIFFYYPLFLNYHSLLTHLLRFEFAVLLLDCERYKPVAESIPQLFSKLGAIVFFAAFFLKRKRVFFGAYSSARILRRVSFGAYPPNVFLSVTCRTCGFFRFRRR